MIDEAVAWSLGETVGTLTFDRAGRVLALGLGDGGVALVDIAQASAEPKRVAAHAGPVLALCADGETSAFVSGGDDGKLCRTGADGGVSMLAEWKGKWVEHVLAPAGAPFRAAAVGKTVHLLDRASGKPLAALDHPSTVGGIAVNPKAKRLAAAHYNGLSLWWTHGRAQQPKRLEWRGSHLAAAWSPCGEYVVTAMQDNSLHGWRLSDGADMRMSGYPQKVRSMAWSAQPYFLVTSGAGQPICWPFSGQGPMGKTPVEVGYGRPMAVTAVACHPKGDMIAAGYADGGLALGRISTREARMVRPPGGGPVAALAFAPDGKRFAFATEDGKAGMLDAPAR